MRLVIIDNRIREIDNITGSLTAETEYLVCDFYTDTISTIRDKIVSNYESVAIIQHNYNLDTYQFVADCSSAILSDIKTADPELDTWRDYIGFLVWLKEERGVGLVDLLACDLWADENWKYMIETVRNREGVYIRASIDQTGAGGNFVLESDGVDMVGVYFTEGILEYKYAFYSSGYPVMTGYINFSKYTLPSSNLGSITSRYTGMTGGGTTLNYTNVVSVTSNIGAVAILHSDNRVSILGLTANGGTTYTTSSGTPPFTLSLTDLTNIKKIVSTKNAFCALKNDGSVFCWGGLNTYGSNTDINNGSSTSYTNFNSVKTNLATGVVDIF